MPAFQLPRDALMPAIGTDPGSEAFTAFLELYPPNAYGTKQPHETDYSYRPYDRITTVSPMKKSTRVVYDRFSSALVFTEPEVRSLQWGFSVQLGHDLSGAEVISCVSLPLTA